MIDQARTDPRLTPQGQADMASALRTFARLMGQQPEVMPALASVYRPRLTNLAPVTAGLSAKRIANLKSLVLKAMSRHGTVRRSGFAPLAPAWRVLRDRLTMTQRCQLSRFMTWASATRLLPAEVNDDAFDRFRQALIQESFVRHPAERVAMTCRTWEQVRTHWPDLQLPPVSIPRLRQTYGLHADRFTPSFQRELHDFCARLAGADRFAEDGPPRPLKPVSVKRRRFQVLQLASGLTHKGIPVAEIRCLADLVRPEALRRSLTYFLERTGNRTTTQISQLGYVAKVIARHVVRCDVAQMREVEAIVREVTVRPRGLTSKNTARLRQFDDPVLTERLLFFPQDLMEKLEKSDRGAVRTALQAESAAAAAILLAAPIRLANLASLRLGAHVLTSRSGQQGVWHLVLGEHETKNAEPREHILGPDSVAVLRVYIDRFRPRLTVPGNNHLFPSRAGHKAPNSLGTALSASIRRHTGLVMNAHLFRHFAAKLILEASPGAYTIVQDVLGHRDIATTRSHYAGAQTAAAGRHFDTVLRDARAKFRPRGKGKP